jgi:uncharacterized alpha-E superfamily protein
VLADEGNPRGLAFQVATAAGLLQRIAGAQDVSLAGLAASLRQELDSMVHSVETAPDQARAATLLPPRLRALRDAVADLSDRVSRRYFALLPTARSVGVDTETPALLGAA